MPPPLCDFGYEDVALGDGHWKRQRDHVIELYLSLSDSDIVEAALRASQTSLRTGAKGLPGWGGTFGQFLASFAKLYRVTGDARLQGKCVRLFEMWAEYVRQDAQALVFGTYEYEKLLGGLLDMVEYLGRPDLRKTLSDCISDLTDAAIRTFDQSIDRDGLQDHRMRGQIEWYTLPENLYRAYELFGDDKYRDYAEVWRYDYLIGKIRNRDFDSIGPRHAYSHVNALSSIARAYEVTGDNDYLNVLKAAYQELVDHHTYATGGYGPGEVLFMNDHPGYLGFMLQCPWDLGDEDPTFTNFAGGKAARSDAWGSCEVSCCSWAVLKLCNYLLKFTGEAKYGMWAEQVIVNCLGGQPDIKPNGELLYYASYFADGAMKSTLDRRLQRGGRNFVWQCCSGTFPQDVAEYANAIYYCDDNGLYISQYLPSTVRWERPGGDVIVENISDFPQEGPLTFNVRFAGPTPADTVFPISFRVPAWATADNTVHVNGVAIETPIRPNEWLTLERRWSDGDRIDIEYPYRLWFRSVDEQHADWVALNYGPLVLVSDQMTILVGDRDHPEAWIRPVDGKPFTFETQEGHAGVLDYVRRTFSPYYSFPENQWYFMYHRIYRSDDEQEEVSRTINV